MTFEEVRALCCRDGVTVDDVRTACQAVFADMTEEERRALLRELAAWGLWLKKALPEDGPEEPGKPGKPGEAGEPGSPDKTDGPGKTDSPGKADKPGRLGFADLLARCRAAEIVFSNAILDRRNNRFLFIPRTKMDKLDIDAYAAEYEEKTGVPLSENAVAFLERMNNIKYVGLPVDELEEHFANKK